jgi:LacI family transcriptional regulator
MPDGADSSAAPDANVRVTVYDVAAEAGTSVSTVSRVLNGSSLAAEETRRAVLAAAERLGYTQRRVRRSAARSVLNIAVFLPQAAEPHAHLFYDAAALFTGIQSGLGSVRAHTIAALNGSTSPFEGKKLGDIDGCIFAFSSPPQEVREMLLEREIPTVVLNRLDDDFACVVNDFTHGMRTLSEQVVQRRSTPKAAFVTVQTAQPVADYRWSALASQDGALVDERDRYEYASIRAISQETVRLLLNEGYETFVCVNDLVAVAVHDRLAALGVRVPQEVGVTGYDAAPVRGLISRELTSVDLAVEKLGHEAAERLVRAVLGRTVPTGRMMIPGELIPGASL